MRSPRSATRGLAKDGSVAKRRLVSRKLNLRKIKVRTRRRKRKS